MADSPPLFYIVVPGASNCDVSVLILEGFLQLSIPCRHAKPWCYCHTRAGKGQKEENEEDSIIYHDLIKDRGKWLGPILLII
jgi:hypothetical protein